jgi:hypothetical protein
MQEFKVEAYNTSAEYRQLGTVTMVTKAGSNASSCCYLLWFLPPGQQLNLVVLESEAIDSKRHRSTQVRARRGAGGQKPQQIKK